jgi:folate-dependent phosphoribosylglycinamide formyltransferase PurN
MSSTTKEQIEMIEDCANKIWNRCTPYEVQERLLGLWDRLADERGMKLGFEPLYKIKDTDHRITCGILGSGGFSTGREELYRAQKLKNNLGSTPAPVEYTAVITNRERSNAQKVAQEFGLPSLLVDYTEWRKTNEVSGSTKLFGFESGQEPPIEVLEERVKIKKAFDLELHNAMVERLGKIPESISLRGYDFILTDQLFSCDTEVDNTHPANLIIRQANGEPTYAGWQEVAYNKMREDGFNRYQTTLIRVGYIGSCSDLVEVDAGEMIAISPGNIGEYDKIEDHFLLTLKATGLLPYFWGLSKESERIEYKTITGEPVFIEQKSVIVGDQVMAGRNVFGQNEVDLNIFTRVLGF